MPMEQVFKVDQNINFHPNCNSFVFRRKMKWLRQLYTIQKKNSDYTCGENGLCIFKKKFNQGGLCVKSCFSCSFVALISAPASKGTLKKQR